MKEFLKRNKDLLISAFVMGLLPLICCIVHCKLQGYGLRDVYLPASQWNDELFYFKQVEAILEEAKNDSNYTLVKYSSQYKEKKEKGEVVDYWYRLTLTKAFTDEKEPDRDVQITYGV